MKIHFTVDNRYNHDSVARRIVDHLTKRGFRQNKTTKKGYTLSFRRGFNSFSSMSPEEWKCKTLIKIAKNPDQVDCEFDIDTRWQWVLPWEKKFWNTEAAQLEEAIHGTDIRYRTIEKYLRRAILLNIAFIPVALLIIVPLVSLIVVGPLWVIGTIFEKTLKLSTTHSVVIGIIIWFPLLIFLLRKVLLRISKKQ